jgi:hypothetical protein
VPPEVYYELKFPYGRPRKRKFWSAEFLPPEVNYELKFPNCRSKKLKFWVVEFLPPEVDNKNLPHFPRDPKIWWGAKLKIEKKMDHWKIEN